MMAKSLQVAPRLLVYAMRRSSKKFKKKRRELDTPSIQALVGDDPLETISTDLIAALKSAGCDALVRLARFAKGDVVGLEMMNQDEIDADEEYDSNGILVKESGKSRALHLIPPSIRAKCLIELTGYLIPKKKEAEKPLGEIADVKFYIPDNGRDEK